jgi:hypothetical protein
MQLGRVLCVQGRFFDYQLFTTNKDKLEYKLRTWGGGGGRGTQ